MNIGIIGFWLRDVVVAPGRRGQGARRSSRSSMSPCVEVTTVAYRIRTPTSGSGRSGSTRPRASNGLATAYRRRSTSSRSPGVHSASGRPDNRGDTRRDVRADRRRHHRHRPPVPGVQRRAQTRLPGIPPRHVDDELLCRMSLHQHYPNHDRSPKRDDLRVATHRSRANSRRHDTGLGVHR